MTDWDTPLPPTDNMIAATGDWNDAAPGGGFTDDHTATGGDDFGGISSEHVSKHEGADDDACRNCGQTGHFKRDCPEPPKNSGECYNCGEQGHNKADCPNETIERAFTGECRVCGEVGHRGAECPKSICKKCGESGHTSSKCENAYDIHKDVSVAQDPDAAWEALVDADANGEVDDFKKAFAIYTKTCPELTFPLLETCFREQNFKHFIIAKEPVVSDVHTNVDLQGVADRKYVVSFQHVQGPRRKIGSEAWPKTPEENLQRLENAGFPMDRMVPKCRNCNNMGHVKKNCPQMQAEIEKPVITCANCHEVGHYIRDCSAPRVDRNACRNCGQSGHRASDCTEPRNAENVECKVCNEMGHFARDCPTKPVMACRNCGEEGHKATDCVNERVFICRNCNTPGHVARDCDQPRNMDTVECRNCDQMGHFSKDCPEPKNWAKVQCRNCGESRCTNPSKEEDAPADASFSENNAGEGDYTAVAATGGWDTAETSADPGAAGEDGWGAAPGAEVTAW